MSPPRLLALDFDGVVSDSAPESFVVALRTCVALPDAPLPEACRALASRRAPSLTEVAACPDYPAFLDAMPLGNRAEDFGVVLAALARGQALPDQASYDAALARHDEAWREAFHARFYQERARLSDEDREAWLALMGPYQPFLDVLRRRAGDCELAIATAKDGESVQALLAAYGVQDLFDAERVIDKEAGRSKRAHLSQLSLRTGCAYEEILFVDDKVNHLDVVAELGVTCALAGWGYNGPREVRIARERGYTVLELARVEAQLFGDVRPVQAQG